MEDLLTRGMAREQTRNQDNPLRGAPRRGYAEIPTREI